MVRSNQDTGSREAPVQPWDPVTTPGRMICLETS